MAAALTPLRIWLKDLFVHIANNIQCLFDWAILFTICFYKGNFDFAHYVRCLSLLVKQLIYD